MKEMNKTENFLKLKALSLVLMHPISDDPIIRNASYWLADSNLAWRQTTGRKCQLFTRCKY
ncbi:hypothetical protein NQ317_000011 [Molorchus minor]|uniref:Uncharacterized protein n=1 Tax=Molorchus minor TaxID=1323400 RepID=A0ABQ9K154_9CUCU|nr:hypothetical protein NQ317_000011 [Molorchus minor]